MQLGTHVGMLATILAIFALAIGSVAVMEPNIFHSLPTGPQGPAGPSGAAGHNGANGANGTNGRNGTNGTSGSNGQNGTNGHNGTTWMPLWYGFDPTPQYTGTLTYLTITDIGCTDAGQGANYCLFNVTNTCGPESGVHAEWACADWYYGLVNVSYPVNGSFYFTGSDPSLGYAIGWGQTVTVQLWFQTVVYTEYASGSTPPNVPTLTPTIDLGFAEVSG
jgi:Collagen triple helix repeat (20 copies)